MTFQQRISIVASPKKKQDIPTSILSLIQQFFLARAAIYATDSAYVRRIDYENAITENGNTLVDMIVTIEATSIQFSDLFLKSFLRRDETFPFILVQQSYVGI